jgi:hypothetical protein
MPCMLFATLLLLARLIAPAPGMAMPLPTDQVELALQIICHADAPAAPDGPSQPDHTDCQLCPACHLASHAAFPTPTTPAVPPPPVVVIDIGAPLPPATGPPSRARVTAQPTGPPSLSA